MDIWTIVVSVGVIVGIIAGTVQVVEYLQKRRKEPAEPTKTALETPTPPRPPIPHNLPPRREFIGREREKARVHEALRSRSYLVSIDGIGGIGKTVLALEVAHECLRASTGDASTEGIAAFDGFIWTTAKDRDLTLNGLLDAVARTLEYPGIAQQPVEVRPLDLLHLSYQICGHPVPPSNARSSPTAWTSTGIPSSSLGMTSSGASSDRGALAVTETTIAGSPVGFPSRCRSPIPTPTTLALRIRSASYTALTARRRSSSSSLSI